MSALFHLFLCFRSSPEKLEVYIPTFYKIRYILEELNVEASLSSILTSWTQPISCFRTSFFFRMSFFARSRFVPREGTGQAVKIERNWVPYSNILIPLITLSSINEEFWSSRQWWQTSSVSWVMEFLTWGYKISLVFSKNEWSSKKLLYFVNQHSMWPTKIGHNFRKKGTSTLKVRETWH